MLGEKYVRQRTAYTHFDMASSDGSRVFFTDTQQLTADSRSKDTANVRYPDLYVCQMVEIEEAGQKKLKCDVTDLSPDSNPDGESADVQGSVLAASEDGSLVYFVANGVLGDGGEHGATRLRESSRSRRRVISMWSITTAKPSNGKRRGSSLLSRVQTIMTGCVAISARILLGLRRMVIIWRLCRIGI